MAPAESGPCSCPCCKKDKCTCTGEPGKDCHCTCCQRHACTCGARHPGGQQEACKCPCCVRKSCTCKQPSDCSCSECPKHACLCASASEKKKTAPCDCCCCKNGTTCCSETPHQQTCDCRCCKEKTCACCKIKQARAAGDVAEPASGKVISESAHDCSEISGNSSSIRCSHPARTSGGTIQGACCQEVASCSGGHWNGSVISNCRHWRPCSPMHFCNCNSHRQCCRSIESQCATTTMYKRNDAEEDTTNDFSTECRKSMCRSAHFPCYFPAYVPCGFVGPRCVSYGCARKQDACYQFSSMQLCDRDCCCSRNISSCSSYAEGPAGRTIVNQKLQSSVDATEGCLQPDRRDRSASLIGEVESSSSSGAAEQHSGAKHLHIGSDQSIHCAGCCHYWRCRPTWNVAVEEHEWQRRHQIERLKCLAEHQRQQSANRKQPQELQVGDGRHRNSKCIVDFNGRVIIECKTKEKILLRRMQPDDYPVVRALLPRVSRCTLVLTEQQIHDVLSSSVFYAWCCFTVEPNLYQQGQEGTLAQTVTQNQVEEQHPTTQQQTEAGGRQQHQALRERHLLQQEVKEIVPEHYREKQLVAYCELVLQPRLGRKTDGRLERVVVNEAFCGRGIASQMCAAVLAAVKERQLCEFVDLTVEKDEARHIYEDKLGFRKVETTVLRLQL